MNEVPNIAKARLAVQRSTAGPHPDADQLTAFVEQSLAVLERETVLAHLSVCADCREVVALVAPEVPVALPAIAGGGFRTHTFLGMNWMRWAAVSACVVVLASVVMYNRQNQPEQLALQSDDYAAVQNKGNTAPTSQSAPVHQVSPTGAPTEAKPADNNKPVQMDKLDVNKHDNTGMVATAAGDPTNAKEERMRLDAKKSPLDLVATTNGFIQGPTDLKTKSYDRGLSAAAAAPASPQQQRNGINRIQQQPGGSTANQYAYSTTSTGNGVAGGVAQPNALAGSRGNESKSLADSNATKGNLNFEWNDQQKQQNVNSLKLAPVDATTSATAPGTFGGSLVANNTVAPAPTKTMAAGKPVINSNAPKNTTIEVTAAAPAINTTSADVVNQSLDKDARQNAEKAIVINDSSLTLGKMNNRTNLSPATPEPPASQKYRLLVGGRLIHLDASSNTWQPIEIVSGFKVHAIFEFTGTALVAGTDGSTHGLLYRTRDNKIWTRVNGQWTGDIVALRFSSATAGELITSTGETWNTADGGVTWKKQ